MTTMTEAPLLEKALKTYFGFETFRPHQKEIIEALLKKQDVFAILPTGGGKSLCFQLPAVVTGGLTLVVSPLIALMKDQVDSLKTNGVPAAFLNSSITSSQWDERVKNLNEGRIRLLYVAPERLNASGFFDQLKKWNVNLVAIDEAHCISEWGHDFRPDYRLLSRVRTELPKAPILALTATATARVREDIVAQLHLKKPHLVVASFNRPNLTYRVLPKHKGYDQLVSFLRTHPNESGIVYCLSRKTCEELSLSLKEEGFSSRPYHAGLEPNLRSLNQELFIRDEIRLVCATIAFGMGIHKSNVRFVVHYNLPRNIESYYQETGRAGRDGLPSDCLFFYTPADARKLARFIDEKSSEQERKIAHRQLKDMRIYAESAQCRRATLLQYFGEPFQGPCGGCDNCLSPRNRYDATTPAQKLLSCVFRIRQKSGFSTGLVHVVDVLLGKETEKIVKWGHQQLSTFGIGRDMKRQSWISLGEELLKEGYLDRSNDAFETAHLTTQGAETLTQRKPIWLTSPLIPLKKNKRHNGEPLKNNALFDVLRTLRKKLADERQVPAYIVFSDATLKDLADAKPKTLSEFAHINGVGDKKLREFGPIFIEEIRNFREKE